MNIWKIKGENFQLFQWSRVRGEIIHYLKEMDDVLHITCTNILKDLNARDQYLKSQHSSVTLASYVHKKGKLFRRENAMKCGVGYHFPLSIGDTGRMKGGLSEGYGAH